MTRRVLGWLARQATPGGIAVLALAVLRAAWGAACLLAPGPLVRAAGRTPSDEAARVVLRLLGARHVLQALVSAISPGRAFLRLGACVDAVHAVGLVVLAALDRRWSRAALADAAVAAAWGVLTQEVARSAPRAGPTRRERFAGAVLQRLLLPVG